MEKKQQRFTTLDIYLAAYLEYRGIPAELEKQCSRVIFTFPQSDELYRLTSAFNSNDPVPVTDFVSHVRMLRGRMISKRDQTKAVLLTKLDAAEDELGREIGRVMNHPLNSGKIKLEHIPSGHDQKMMLNFKTKSDVLEEIRDL